MLVFGFGVVERGGRENFGGDGRMTSSLQAGLVSGFGGLGLSALGRGEGEDDGAVLGAAVVALTVALGGVVGLPEGAEEVGVREVGGVVYYKDGFGMAGGASADFGVGGGAGVVGATAIAGGGGVDAGELPEEAFGTPEATKSKGGLVEGRGEGRVERVASDGVGGHREGVVRRGGRGRS